MGRLKSTLLRIAGLGDPSHPLIRKCRDLRRRLRSTDERFFAAYLEAHPDPKLQLGASNHLLSGWLNTDLEPGEGVAHLDATKPFPLPSGLFECVHAEHMIEHLPFDDGLLMLRECHRILRPGGVLRIVTPDLHCLLGLYAKPLSQDQETYLEWMRKTFTPETPEPASVFVINTFFRSWGHQFIYDEATLRGAMIKAGFRVVRNCRLGVSEHPDLCQLENVARYPAGLLQFESIALEAVKS